MQRNRGHSPPGSAGRCRLQSGRRETHVVTPFPSQRWYAGKKDFGKLLAEDQLIRTKLMEKLKQASVPRIFITRRKRF